MHYAKIIPFDLANGNGIRIALFVSGCKARCPGCFNAELHDFMYGKEFSEKTKQRAISLLNNPYVAGLSILGGDPLWQDDGGMTDLIDLIKRVHGLHKTVWIWSGFTWESVMTIEPDDKLETARQELIKSCDVFVDGLFIEEKKDLRLKWRGSSNQRVIDVQKSLKARQIVLYKEKNTI